MTSLRLKYIYQNATECLAAMVAGARQDIISWGADPGFTMRSLLDVASRSVYLLNLIWLRYMPKRQWNLVWAYRQYYVQASWSWSRKLWVSFRGKLYSPAHSASLFRNGTSYSRSSRRYHSAPANVSNCRIEELFDTYFCKIGIHFKICTPWDFWKLFPSTLQYL